MPEEKVKAAWYASPMSEYVIVHAASVLGENPKAQRDNDKLLAAGFRLNSSPPSSPSSVASFAPVRGIIAFLAL